MKLVCVPICIGPEPFVLLSCPKCLISLYVIWESAIKSFWCRVGVQIERAVMQESVFNSERVENLHLPPSPPPEQAYVSHLVPALTALGKPTRCRSNSHAMGSSAGQLVWVLLEGATMCIRMPTAPSYPLFITYLYSMYYTLYIIYNMIYICIYMYTREVLCSPVHSGPT